MSELGICCLESVVFVSFIKYILSLTKCLEHSSLPQMSSHIWDTYTRAGGAS